MTLDLVGGKDRLYQRRTSGINLGIGGCFTIWRAAMSLSWAESRKS